MPKGLFLWQSEAGKYLKFRGPLNHVLEVQAEGLWILHTIPAEEQGC